MLKIDKDNPKIILMVNDFVGLKITEYLVNAGENIVALVLHDKEKQKMAPEIIKVSKLNEKNIYLADYIKQNSEILFSYKPDLIITCYWAYLLKPEVFNIPQYGCINFHPGLLPKNRGWYPNVWPFIDGSKPGVTLHLIDEGADTGPIISQKEVSINLTDNAGDLYNKLQNAMINLFKKTWVNLKNIGVELKRQDNNFATFHKKKDIKPYNLIDLDKKYKAKDLINILRARTFNDKAFAYYFEDNKKILIKLVLENKE